MNRPFLPLPAARPTTVEGCLAAAAQSAGHDSVFLDGTIALTFAQTLERVAAHRETLRRSQTRRPILLPGPTSVNMILWVLAALAEGTPVILAPPTFTAAETASMASWAGAAIVNVDTGRIEAGAAPTTWPERAALAFATSGSTGAPRLALRCAASLLAEGERYRALLEAGPDDVFMAAMPVAHAFTFGAALMGALASGARLCCRHFTSPRDIAETVCRSGVTFLPLVNAVARALAKLDRGAPVRSRLRVAMVGAGPFTLETSRAFAAKWGVGLASNYGSSETGATLARLPDDPWGTGRPMPGIACEVVGEPERGQFWVRTGTPPLGHLTPQGFQPFQVAPGGYVPTGDIATQAADGMISILGRTGSEIRRGGHTIVPAEVARAIEDIPGVADALVRGVEDGTGEQAVEAHVVFHPESAIDLAAVQETLRTRLAPHKIPTRWHVHDALPSTWSGKPVLRPAERQGGGQGSRQGRGWLHGVLSYRIGEAIQAADLLGLFDRLREPATEEELVARTGWNLAALRLLTSTLVDADVLARQDRRLCSRIPADPAVTAVLRLERHLRRTWLSSESIAEAVRAGEGERPFDRMSDPVFDRLYRDVMTGPAYARCLTAILRSHPLPAAARVAEIGRGIGWLARQVAARFPDSRCDLHPIAPAPAIVDADGAAPPAVSDWTAVALAPGTYDLISVYNAVHWLRPGDAGHVLRGLLRALRPSGVLVVVDLFAPVPEDVEPDGDIHAGFRIDWLTHGGLHFATRPEFEAALCAIGARPTRLAAPRQPFTIITSSSIP